MDTEVVALAIAIVRTICILIVTNPLPVIFIKCKLVRSAVILAILVDRSRVPAVTRHKA